MRKLLYLFILFLPITLLADNKTKKDQPAKVSTLLKAAKTAIKNGKDQKKAEENLVAAAQREDVTNPQRAEIYYTCSELEHSLNDAQNLKAYLKQSYDTTEFFSTILKMYQFALRCDSIEQIPNNGKVKFNHRGKIRVVMTDPRYHRNLFLGGNYMMRKQLWSQAWQYFNLYRSLSDEPIMTYNTRIQSDTLLLRASYLSTVSAFNACKYQDALRYIDESIGSQDSARQVALCEYKARCYEQLKDSVQWLQALQDGVNCHPEHAWFFQHLIDYYDDTKRYDDALALCNVISLTLGEKALYYQGKSKILLSKSDYTGCIEASNQATALDSTCSEAYYNKGIAYLNMALEYSETACNDLHNPKCIKDRKNLKNYYEQAREPLEEFQRLKPELKNRWASPLYRIYLNLNMGKKFDEIEEILKTL